MEKIVSIYGTTALDNSSRDKRLHNTEFVNLPRKTKKKSMCDDEITKCERVNVQETGDYLSWHYPFRILHKEINLHAVPHRI